MKFICFRLQEAKVDLLTGQWGTALKWVKSFVIMYCSKILLNFAINASLIVWVVLLFQSTVIKQIMYDYYWPLI